MKNRTKVNLGIISQGQILNVEHGKLLAADYTKEHTKRMVFAIPGVKSLGPDGYSSYFYQDAWDIVGEAVMDAVHSCLVDGKILRQVNNTVITLIPKMECPNGVGDYRTIACCNVIYKVMTKFICSKLKLILLEIVAQNQGEFIASRFIAHNIMLCRDLVKHYGREKVKLSCLIKLDIRKAYDSLEWGFIEEILIAYRFHMHFIQLEMECIRTLMYSLMFNGTMHGFFKAKRGLRQGDPMSPLILVLAMDCLSRILKKASEKERRLDFMKGVRG